MELIFFKLINKKNLCTVTCDFRHHHPPPVFAADWWIPMIMYWYVVYGSPHWGCPGPSPGVHQWSGCSWWQRAVCPHCETETHTHTTLSAYFHCDSNKTPSQLPFSDQPRGRQFLLTRTPAQVSLTWSISSQSSRPTKIISRGRRCRVPELLTRNHDVTLIFTGLLRNPRASWEMKTEAGDTGGFVRDCCATVTDFKYLIRQN